MFGHNHSPRKREPRSKWQMPRLRRDGFSRLLRTPWHPHLALVACCLQNKLQKSSTSSHLDFIMSTPIVLTFLCASSIWLLDGENLETNKKKMLSKMLGNPWLFFLLGRWRIIDLIDTDTWFCARICRDVLGTPWFYSVLSTHRTRAYVSQFPLEICESSFFHPKCLVSKLLTSRKFSLLGKSPT